MTDNEMGCAVLIAWTNCLLFWFWMTWRDEKKQRQKDNQIFAEFLKECRTRLTALERWMDGARSWIDELYEASTLNKKKEDEP